ncbi:MAG: M48 family metallopeptidase [Muribaculaceae bacterium]
MFISWIVLAVLLAYCLHVFFSNYSKIYVFALLPILCVGIAIVVILAYRPHTSRGIAVTKSSAPLLFDLIDDVAELTGCGSDIDKVILTPGMSVSVGFDTNIYNFFHSPKPNLFVGVSLCNVLSKNELAAVIAHELAHFAQPQAKQKAYLAHISNITASIGQNGIFAAKGEFGSLMSHIYSWPARLFCKAFSFIFDLIFAFSAADYKVVSANMELDADRVSAKAFGRDVMLSALCKSYVCACRLSLYKSAVLPFLSGNGYRCDGFWNTFVAAGSLFKSIDGMDVNIDAPLLHINSGNINPSHSIIALRLDALQNMSIDAVRQSADTAALDIIPSGIQTRMDRYLCGKYNQTSGLPIGRVRLSELLEQLRVGLFNDVCSMTEALTLVRDILSDNQQEPVHAQILMPGHMQSPCDIVPHPIVFQPSDFFILLPATSARCADALLAPTLKFAHTATRQSLSDALI